MKTVQRSKAKDRKAPVGRPVSAARAADHRNRGNRNSGSAISDFVKGLTSGFVAEDSVLSRAVEVIGDAGEAMRWMGTPVRALGYATPVSLLGTEEGASSVLAVLSKLEHGVL